MTYTTRIKIQDWPKVRLMCGEVQRIRGPNARPERWIPSTDYEAGKWQNMT